MRIVISGVHTWGLRTIPYAGDMIEDRVEEDIHSEPGIGQDSVDAFADVKVGTVDVRIALPTSGGFSYEKPGGTKAYLQHMRAFEPTIEEHILQNRYVRAITSRG